MSYTTIDKPSDYFNTVLYTGNGSTQSITGVGFQPDWVWLKQRSGSSNHRCYDSVRGATKQIYPNLNNAENTETNGLTSFDSDGFSLGNEGGHNENSKTFASWNWLAGGSAPAITYSVKVVSDSGNKYRFDDFGTSAVTLDLQEGGTYTFDQSDSSNSGHPLRFSTTSDGTHGVGSEYTTNVTTTGTPGSAGAKTVITVGSGVATLYYYCTQHSGMGGQANTNSTFGSSNFSGSIQSTVSANTTSGFSIVTWSGNSSSATIGHGLGTVPKMHIVKRRTNGTGNWLTYHAGLSANNYLYLNESDAQSSTGYANRIPNPPTSSVFSVGSDNDTNGSNDYVAYVFAEKKGYSKIGSYTGNGNANGTFVYNGFKPSFILGKSASGTSAPYENWFIYDNKRNTFNPTFNVLFPNRGNAEGTNSAQSLDLLSNGFKAKSVETRFNESGTTYIFMAFAENPFVTSTGIPTTAR